MKSEVTEALSQVVWNTRNWASPKLYTSTQKLLEIETLKSLSDWSVNVYICIRLHKITPLGHLKYKAGDHLCKTALTPFSIFIIEKLYHSVCVFLSRFQISHPLNFKFHSESKFYLGPFGCYHNPFTRFSCHSPVKKILKASRTDLLPQERTISFFTWPSSVCLEKFDVACPRPSFSNWANIFLLLAVRRRLFKIVIGKYSLLGFAVSKVIFLLPALSVWFTLFVMKYCSIFLVVRMFRCCEMF